MRAGRVSPHIRKVEILRDEKSLRSLRAVPDIGVDTAIQLPLMELSSIDGGGRRRQDAPSI